MQETAGDPPEYTLAEKISEQYNTVRMTVMYTTVSPVHARICKSLARLGAAATSQYDCRAYLAGLSHSRSYNGIPSIRI